MRRPSSIVRPAFGGQSPYLDPNDSHARFYGAWRHLESFKTLSPLQRCLLQDILMGFSKHTGNEVRLTASGVRKRYSVGHKTARDAICALELRGWIDRIGLGPGPTGQAGGLYELLCMDPLGNRIRGPYLNWRSDD